MNSSVDNKIPKQFKDTTAGDFLNQRLVELGLIKKLETS